MTLQHEPTTPTSVAPQVLLGNHLKALKLPTFAREYEKVAMESAQDRADYPRYARGITTPQGSCSPFLSSRLVHFYPASWHVLSPLLTLHICPSQDLY